MVTIRLQRKGRKKLPYYRIVVADNRSPRDGRYIEHIGHLDNITQDEDLHIKEDRVIWWLKQGAQPSQTVKSLLKKYGIYYRMHLINWGWDEEKIEKTITEWRENRTQRSSKRKKNIHKELQARVLELEQKKYEELQKNKAAEEAEQREKEKVDQAKAQAQDQPKDVKADSEPTVDSKAQEETKDAPTETKDVKADSEPTVEPKAQEEAKDAPTETKDVKADSEPKVDSKAQEKPKDAPTKTKDVKADSKPKVDSKAQKEPKDTPTKTKDVKTDNKPKVDSKAQKETKDAPTKTKDVKTDKAMNSMDMKVKEAIQYIQDHPLEKLEKENFVTENEKRKTVLASWEKKKNS